jgi:uncharacterized spore protein YtfJ
MNVPEMLKRIGEQVQTSASSKNVYGEPVSVGDRTVISVARIRYGFGGGGSSQSGDAENSDHGGGGGGGHVSAAPVGIVEITPTGTRFMPIPDWPKTIALIAFAFGLGFVAGRSRMPKEDSDDE